MDIKLIALDLDGTLLGADHAHIPQRNLDALRAAAERGVRIAIASGRSWSLIRETARDLGPVRYGITANGAYVLDAVTGETMGQTGMDREQCAAIIGILRRYDLPYELYIDGDNYVQRSELEGMAQYALSDQFRDMFLRNATIVDDMLAALDAGTPEKFDVFYVPPEVHDPLLAELEATGPFGRAGALGSNLEITAVGANKGAALAALSAQMGLTAGEVMAFGDADNDLEMLSWAGWSFAMGNACPAAKAAARYTTGTNAEGGVGMAVEQYVLGR